MILPNSKHPVIIACKAVARAGYDPYNNHTAVNSRFQKVMRDRVRRVSEHEANRLLAKR